MPSDIFGLGLVYETQVESTWPELAEFGYFGGGILPGSVASSIERLDYSNETVGRSVNFTRLKYGLAAVSTPEYGYFGGGVPGPLSTIDRLDFSNETTSAPGTYQLTQARSNLAAVSNSNYGYFAGGSAPPLPQVCTIDRLDFSSETVSAPGKNLTQARYSLAGVSSPQYGYFAGGFAPPLIVCTIDRLDFSNETVAAPGTYQLTQARYASAAVSTPQYGYFAGGVPGPLSSIDRLDFSNETVSAPGNDLADARAGLAAVSNYNYGYFGGGNPGYRSNFYRLDFSNETVLAPGNNLTQARNSLAAVSTKPTTETVRKVRRGEFDASGVVYSNYGYFGGGDSSTNNVSTIDRLDFSNETVSLPGNNLTQARRGLEAVSNSNYGYFGGGSAVPGTIDRLDFPNETVSAPGNNLTQARENLSAVSSPEYGYFAGGNPNLNTIDRLDFPNETVSAPGNNLTQGRESLAGVSNSQYGYFGGGYFNPPPTRVCTIDRLDFSNETVDVPGTLGQLTDGRNGSAAVSNSNYGYFAGGISPSFVNTIDRLDFSNETVSAPSNRLTDGRSGLAAVSNSQYGYFAGGFSPGNVCTIDRLDFSTETVDVPGTLQQLTEARYGLAGTNIPLNQTRHAAPQEYYSVLYGYFGGGLPFTDAIVRFDFNTELNSSIPTVLTRLRRGAAAVSTPQYGYFGGGSAPLRTCTFDRLDFSTETVESPGSYNLSYAQFWLGAVSNSNYGYFGGGYALPKVCAIDRLDFSTETAAGPPVHGIFLSASRQSTVSTPDYGYFTGSVFNTPLKSDFDRLDFSTETVTGPPVHGLFLTQARYGSVGIFNSDYGYFAGGDSGANQVCTIDRLDFSTETILNPAASLDQLTQARSQAAAVQSLEYGYFAGGQKTPGPGGTENTSVIDRLEFSSETVSLHGSLPGSKQSMAGVSMKLKLTKPFLWKTNKNTLSYGFGYFGAGFTSNLYRFDFSSETDAGKAAEVFTGSLIPPGPTSIYNMSVASNKNYSYFTAGFTGSTNKTSIARLSFSDETVNDIPFSVLPPASMTNGVGLSSPQYGYFAGGNSSPSTYFCTIYRLDFSNETTSNPPANLTERRSGLAAVSNSNYGYFAGGFTPPLIYYSIIDRLEFSNETVAAPGTYQLTQARTRLSAVSNSNYGYFLNGTIASNTGSSIIDRLDFSNEILATPTTGDSTVSSYYSRCDMQSDNYGYFATGIRVNVPTTYLSRLDFSTESYQEIGYTSKPMNNGVGTQVNYYQKVGIPISKAYGYFAGGLVPDFSSPSTSCTIERLDFSTELTGMPTTLGQLTQRRQDLAAVSNSNYGYFAGGAFPTLTYLCTIDRLDFSNETTSAPGNNLTRARSSSAAVSNSNYGYFAGGNNFPSVPGAISTIDRLDFSNETVTGPPIHGINLPEERQRSAAVSNPNYGYFAGGFSPLVPDYVSTIDRLEFSSETILNPNASLGQLTQARGYIIGVSNSNYGYIAGGNTPNPAPPPISTPSSTIDRLDFSNETVSAPGNNLTGGKLGLAAVSNSNYGYFACGPLPTSTTIERLDFSNETVSVPDSKLIYQRTNSIGVSN